MKLLRTIIITINLIIVCMVSGMAQMLPKFEMRAAWIATIGNIDWPSKKTLTSAEQQQEFIELLNQHQKSGINTVIVQIRPAADAFYPSSFEPWSEYLTGKQGTPPEPYYDPLAFMIEEAHKRGMEFHAWLNPYRAVINIHKSSVSPQHITHKKPDWFVVYGNTKYFNPGIPEVRHYVAGIVKEIVSKYNIDAIHMDDYFYPYAIPGKEFPDEATFRQLGNGKSKDAWRRSNCDSIIKELFETITLVNARVKFGISPFGVWRNRQQDPDGSDTKAGTTNYDDLYADIVLWLKQGWIDYVIPQLYWETNHPLCPFEPLVKWWGNHSYGRQVFIGHGLYKLNTNHAWKQPTELPQQIQITRQYTETVKGSAFFSSSNLLQNSLGCADSLRNHYYALPALVPPMPWIDSVAPAAPTFKRYSTTEYQVRYSGEEPIKAFAVFALAAELPPHIDLATLVKLIPATTHATINTQQILQARNNRILVATVDANNNVSSLVELK